VDWHRFVPTNFEYDQELMIMSALQSTITTLQERFTAQLSEFRDQITLTLPLEQIVSAVRTLRDDFGFDMLVDITAVDYWPQVMPRFHVIYQLRSIARNLHLTLRVAVPGETPSVPTLTGLFPNANWREREVWDLFGIRSEGNLDLRRILMPHDWEGHPLRKDFPLGYEEPQFTFNFEDVVKTKQHAKE
jgi:NADH-quinone oxidoreductase subunit C